MDPCPLYNLVFVYVLVLCAFGPHPHDSCVNGKEGLFVELAHSNCELLMASIPNGPNSGEQTTTTDEEMTCVWISPIMAGRKVWKEMDCVPRWVCSFSHSNSLLICVTVNAMMSKELLSPQWTRSLGWCSGTWLKEEQRVGWLSVGKKQTQKRNSPGQGNWGKGCYGLNIYVFLEFICAVHPLGLWY